MSDYRNDLREFEREARWTFWRMLPLIVIVIGVLSIFAFGLGSLSKIGRTAVEREVFEQSFQRSEALKSQIATDEAVLIEIERKLTNSDLDPSTRANLEAQAAAARIRIDTTRRKQ